MKKQKRADKSTAGPACVGKPLSKNAANTKVVKRAVASRVVDRLLDSDSFGTHDAYAKLENPFFLMGTACSAHALILPIEKLEDLLAQGHDVIAPVSIYGVRDSTQDSCAVEVLQDLREALSWTSHNNNETAAEGLCQITFRLVERLNQLAQRGALFDAPKRIRKWPINFAPGTSDGASKLKDEVALFDALKVGTKSLIIGNPKSRAGMSKQGKGGWRSETEASVEAVILNAQWHIAFHKLRRHSKPIETVEYWHPRMKTKLRVEGFKTPKGRLLLWPWWLDNLPPLAQINPATGLPFLERLDEKSVKLFLPVVEGLFIWRAIFDGAVERLQRRVVDQDEGGEEEMDKLQPELIGKILTGVRNTLMALAGRGRRGSKPK